MFAEHLVLVVRFYNSNFATKRNIRRASPDISQTLSDENARAKMEYWYLEQKICTMIIGIVAFVVDGNVEFTISPYWQK